MAEICFRVGFKEDELANDITIHIDNIECLSLDLVNRAYLAFLYACEFNVSQELRDALTEK